MLSDADNEELDRLLKALRPVSAAIAAGDHSRGRLEESAVLQARIGVLVAAMWRR